MKKNILIILIFIIVIIAIRVIVFMPSKEKEESVSTVKTNTTVITDNSSVVTNNTKTVGAKTIEASLNDNGDVEIKLDDLDTDNATFIQYISNGTNIELVAIKDSNNNIDVAFNTCQVCNGSPKAYFVQKNGKLICENCGNTFTLNSIGASAYGCNPMTIAESDITKIDTGIIISKEFLIENEELFTNVDNH